MISYLILGSKSTQPDGSDLHEFPILLEARCLVDKADTPEMLNHNTPTSSVCYDQSYALGNPHFHLH